VRAITEEALASSKDTCEADAEREGELDQVRLTSSKDTCEADAEREGELDQVRVDIIERYQRSRCRTGRGVGSGKG
jgi:hypothetical protein